jgi:hypothetical protein
VAKGKGKSEMKHEVVVWEGDDPVTVSVTQRSKSVYIASGRYLGKSYEVKAPTEGAAVKRWREAAHYATN